MYTLLYYYDVFFFITVSLLILVSLYICIKINFFHLLKLPTAIKLLFTPEKTEGQGISTFAALSAVLGGNLGTGNISGVAVSLATGGPGSVFWMFIMIIITSVFKYAGCILGIVYCKKHSKINALFGGPMAYIKEAFNNKKTGHIISLIYTIGIVVGAITIGNFIQVNSVVLSLDNTSVPNEIFGIAMSFLVFIVVLGGFKRFAIVVSTIVPILALGYIMLCIYIVIENSEMIIPSIKLIVSSAFNTNALTGALSGLSIWVVIKTGYLRSVMATDIGLGLEAIVHSNIRKNSSISTANFTTKQGLVSALSPMIVMLIVIITTLTFMVTGVWSDPNLTSTNMCVAAFNIAFSSETAGMYITAIIMFFFAFTTILTWMFCAEKAIVYSTSNKYKKLWRITFTLLIPLGSVMNIQLIWGMADFITPIILLPNIIATALLSKNVVDATKASRL